MADALRPLTLLLGAACLWALSVLILALSGLGGRFSERSNGVAPPPIPKVSLTRTQSRLGPYTNYLEVGQRPLLMADRRPGPQPDAEGQATSNDLDVMLTSVLITPRLQLAILTDAKDASTRRVRVGETVQGSNWRLVRLEPRSAVMEGPTGQRTLALRVFNGIGGQAPTPMGQASEGAANGDAGNAEGRRDANSQPAPLLPPPPPAEPSARTVQPIDASTATPASQEQQVEAIRRRIEARRAQMRAEAEAAGNNK